MLRFIVVLAILAHDTVDVAAQGFLALPPLTLAVGDALPALLAGNSVVLKPAEETPYTALATVQLLREAGLPHDVFQVVTGDGATLGDPLIERVDYVSFTGSTAASLLEQTEASTTSLD